jgi:HSP20 family protein
MKNRFSLFNVQQQDPLLGLLFNPQFWDKTPDVLRRIGSMRIELGENENNFVVDIELPGVEKNDISLDIENNVLTVSVETKRDKENELNNKVLHTERYYGLMKRSFALPDGVDDSAIKAAYTNGVLHVTLPKKADVEPESKQIVIE